MPLPPASQRNIPRPMTDNRCALCIPDSSAMQAMLFTDFFGASTFSLCWCWLQLVQTWQACSLLALRMALGSSGPRLARQLLTEAALVSLAGGTAGFATANLLLCALNRWRFGGHLDVTGNAPVYFAGLAFTLASALLFGMLPAWQAWHSNPLQIIKGEAPVPFHMRRFAFRDLLLGAQIAICTLLVTASLVAVQGLMRTLHDPLGFQPQGAMRVEMDLSEIASGTDMTLQEKETLEAVGNIPGVTAAGAVSRTPMTGGMHGIPIFSPGTIEFTLNNS